jgi:transcriptional regulator with XRE-family HTH domain
MEHQKLGHYLLIRRKQAGLSQRALAVVLGLRNEGPLSRYERMEALPPLVTALAYEAVFGIPVSDLFAGVHENIRLDVEKRLLDLQDGLQQTSGKGSQAAATAHVLEWLQERNAESA